MSVLYADPLHVLCTYPCAGLFLAKDHRHMCFVFIVTGKSAGSGCVSGVLVLSHPPPNHKAYAAKSEDVVMLWMMMMCHTIG